MTDFEPDGPCVQVTRHASDRYLERSERSMTQRRATLELARAVTEALLSSELIEVDTRTHLATIRKGRGALFAVVELDGPIERPFGAFVRTVLSGEMALRTFGHVIAVCRELVAA
jgi:hypothetical protein